MTLRPPQPLAAHHDVADFASGEDILDAWLRRRALANQASGASRTFVVCDESDTVAAFYSLSAGAVSPAITPGRFRRHMPDPIPIVLLGRLAVDRRHQGQGLSRALLRDALERVLQASSVIGVRGLVVQALSPAARDLYLHLGFTASPDDDLLLMITLADAVAAMGPSSRT